MLLWFLFLFFCFFLSLSIRLIFVYLPDWSCSAMHRIYYVLIGLCRMKTRNDLCACERVCIPQSGGDRTDTLTSDVLFLGKSVKIPSFCLYCFVRSIFEWTAGIIFIVWKRSHDYSHERFVHAAAAAAATYIRCVLDLHTAQFISRLTEKVKLFVVLYRLNTNKCRGLRLHDSNTLTIIEGRNKKEKHTVIRINYAYD